MLCIFSYKTKSWSPINCQAFKLSSSSLQSSEVYSEPSQISKMELSAKIFNSFQQLTTSTKTPLIDWILRAPLVKFIDWYCIYIDHNIRDLIPRVNGLMRLLKLTKRLCTKLVLALISHILDQIFKIEYKTCAYWIEFETGNFLINEIKKN